MNSLLFGLAVPLAIWIGLLFIRIKSPFGFAVLFPRLTAAALSPRLVAAGLVGAAVSFWVGAQGAAWLFVLALALAFLAASRILAVRGDLDGAFGPDWEQSIDPERRAAVGRYHWRWKMPAPAEPRWERDIPFWTVPDTDRVLLCDVWQPPAGVKPSRLAYIYFHGSAWYILDKDAFTRPLFRHLAARGHLVMDVAYRLYPETDVPGMVGDVKRAIVWLKDHAAEYGIDPGLTVIGGSSAGGHLAQLAGFVPDHPDLTPADVRGRDLTVRGIISCYGPSDLVVCFAHTRQHRIPGVGVTPPDMRLLTSPGPASLERILGKGASRLGLHKTAVSGRLDWLMGGTPDQVPERYALCSPINHVHPGCPPTLLMQGEDDLITSVAATRELFRKLRAAGVPVVNVIFPYTDHMFDLALPLVSPSAQRALYEAERFLAVVAGQ